VINGVGGDADLGSGNGREYFRSVAGEPHAG